MLTSLKTKRNWATCVRANQTNSAAKPKSKLARNLFLMTLVASLAGGSYWYYQTQQEEREETLVKMIKERLRNLRQQLPKNSNAASPALDGPVPFPVIASDATAPSAEENTNVASRTHQGEPIPIATSSDESAVTTAANNDAPEEELLAVALAELSAAPEALLEEVAVIVEAIAVPILVQLEEEEQQQPGVEREVSRALEILAEDSPVEPTSGEVPAFLQNEQLAFEEAEKRVELLLAVLGDIAKENQEAFTDTVERIDQDGAIDAVMAEVDRRLREEASERAEFDAREEAERVAALEFEAARERQESEARERAEREERERLERVAQEEQAAREEEARQKREAEARALAELQRAEELAEQQAAAEKVAKEQERLRQETKDVLIAEIHDVLQTKQAATSPSQADSQYTAVIANDVVQALLDKILAEKLDHLATEQELADVYNAHLRSQSDAYEAALEKEVAQYNAHLVQTTDALKNSSDLVLLLLTFEEALHAGYEREINNFMRQAKGRYDEDLKREFNALVGESELVHQDILQHHLDALHDYSALLQLYGKQDDIVYETEGMLRNVQAYLALESINDNAGYPFGQQLSDVAKLVQSDDFMSRALARITPTAANSGIRTLHQLQDDFNSVDLQTRQRAQNESQESAGFFSSLFASSPKQYPAGLVPGDDYNAILARAKYYLQSKGNLDKAISELDQLPPVLKEQCESWIERANDRRNLDDVTRTFRARVLMQTTNARDTWSSVMPVNIQKQFEDRHSRFSRVMSQN